MQKLINLYQNLESPKQRRKVLLREMAQLNDGQVDCATCSGKCCTFMANSMQLTPIEAFDMMQALILEKKWDQEQIKKLKECIKEFRLDYHLDTGGGHGFRRTYTCPFFMGKSLGCSISKDKNPYGCLGFNPTQSGELEGKSCFSNQDLLDEQEKSISEMEKSFNEEFRKLYPDYGQKLPIPNALVFLFEANFNRL